MTNTTTAEPIAKIGRIETPRQFSQLGLLVADGSGSMTEQAVGNISKAQATNNATRELFTRFKVSRVARNFSFALVTFDSIPQVRLQPTEVGPMLDDNADYNPLNGHGGGTNIYAALEEAEQIVNSYLASAPLGGVPYSVVILIMSDGCCSDPSRTKQVADRIKNGPNGSRIRICSSLFATVGSTDVAGETLLREVASDPVMGYKTVYDGETLRAFFEKSMSAASGGIHII
jgi:Mg-chelatase subunit ChlD